MAKRVWSRGKDDNTPLVEKLYKDNLTSFKSAGGFCDDDDEFAEKREEISEKRQRRVDMAYSDQLVPDDCEMCSKPLLDSFLWQKFSHPVCDGCRDDRETHKLISRTEAMKEYLLKDCDLDMRPPPLRYIARKNPHNPRYGDMKLYLKCQVLGRMVEVHGSLEELEEEKKKRTTQKEQRSERKFEKKVKEMKSTIRGMSVKKIEKTKIHEHNYGEESYDEKKDEYSRECEECGFVNRYEKM